VHAKSGVSFIGLPTRRSSSCPLPRTLPTPKDSAGILQSGKTRFKRAAMTSTELCSGLAGRRQIDRGDVDSGFGYRLGRGPTLSMWLSVPAASPPSSRVHDDVPGGN
jgi:hypothetical protein